MTNDGLDPDETLTDGCLCGTVRYTARPGFRMKPYACHCHDCQRRTGSAFGIQLTVLAGDLTVTGEVIEGRHIQPSGAKAAIFACPQCLSRIYTTNDQRAGLVNLRAGTLDNSPGISPAAHFWLRDKQPWLTIPSGVPALETQPGPPEEWMQLLGPGQ